MDIARSIKSKEELIRDFRTEEILDAARRVIARGGLADASVEQIAQEAGVAKGTLYLYFKSKDSLLESACQQVLDDLVRETRGAVSRARGARDKLREVLHIGLLHADQHRAFLLALATEPESGVPLRQLFEPYLRLITSVIDRGVRTGELRRSDSRFVARALLEMMRGALIDPPRASDAGAQADLIVDVLMHGIATGESR